MKTIHFICFMLLCSLSFGQKNESVPASEKFSNYNSVELELAGHATFYSINYERLIFNNEKFKTLGQIGIAFYPEFTNVIPLWIPISINQLFSFHQHHLELGIGQVFTSSKSPHDDSNIYELMGSFKVGYRYQKPDGRFLMKVAFTPLMESLGLFNRHSSEFHPLGGITFGYNF